MDFEWATIAKAPLYAVFINLAQAYNSMGRAQLFEVLTLDLSFPPKLVKAVVLLYKGV